MKCPWCQGTGKGSVCFPRPCLRCNGTGVVTGEPEPGNRIKVLCTCGYHDIHEGDEGTITHVGIDEEPGFFVSMDGPFTGGAKGHHVTFRRQDFAVILNERSEVNGR